MARRIDTFHELRDVVITFKTGVNKDVVLKNVFVSHADESPEWIFTSPCGKHRLVFNSDEISYILISDHKEEISILTTSDEVMYDFSDETYTPEPSKPEPIDPNCSGLRVLVKEDISDGSIELEHYTDKKEEDTNG